MTIYRVGDHVTIVEPKWIKRVGYPVAWTDLIGEIREDQRTMTAWKALGFADIHPDDLPIDFIRGVARQRTRVLGFGGKERTIHYRPLTEVPKNNGLALFLIEEDALPSHGYVGETMRVLSKRVVKTGVRVPSRGYGEDWEPGYLADCHTHVLLRTWVGEIEACHVKVPV